MANATWLKHKLETLAEQAAYQVVVDAQAYMQQGCVTGTRSCDRENHSCLVELVET